MILAQFISSRHNTKSINVKIISKLIHDLVFFLYNKDTVCI